MPAMQTEMLELPAVICARCEYDLRGLGREGRCPECGCEIETSWRRVEALQARGMLPLEFSSRRWLKWMALGCGCVMVAAGGTLADAACITNVVRAPWIDVPAGLVQMVFMVAGLWMLGSREPAMPTRLNRRPVRYGIRAAAILVVAVPMAAGIYPVSAAALMSFWKRVGVLQGIIGSAATVLVFLRLADGARRAVRFRLRSVILILSILAPVLVVTQCFVNTEITYARAALWVLMPEPVLGFAQVILVVPLMLSRRVGTTHEIAVWSTQAILSLAILLTLAFAANLFRRAMSAEVSSNPSSE
jgi:hypothetical protein